MPTRTDFLGETGLKRLRKAVDIIMESPGWKTFFSVVLPVLSAVFSGTFVAEITGPQGLQWNIFYKAWSLYGLFALTVIIYFYNRALYKREKDISRFSDSDFCMAYMRSKCLPEAAEKFREIIRQGHGGELVQIMMELKKSLK